METLSASPAEQIRTTVAKAHVLQRLLWIVIVLAIGFTLFAWNYSRRYQTERLEQRFDREADQVVALVIDRMTKYEDILWAGTAFANTVDGRVEHGQWERFANSIRVEQKYPGINGIGLIEPLQNDEVEAFLAEQRLQRPDFVIHPNRKGEQYWPIQSITPLVGNESAVGLDIAHESNRITAARKARDTGTAQVTGPIILVQDSQKTPGFLFYAPYYGPNGGPNNVDSFRGLVYAPFVFRKLIAGVLESDRRQVGIRLSDSGTDLFNELMPSDSDFDPDPLFKKNYNFDVYGRRWDFSIWSSKSFRDSVDQSQSNFILLAGVLIDLLLIGTFFLIARESKRSIAMADEATGRLEKLGLAAKVNRIGVFDFDPIGGALDWSDSMYELYGLERSSFDGAYQSWLSSVHPDDRAPSEAALEQSMQRGEPFDFEFRIVRPDGEIRYLDAKAVVFCDDSGRAIRVLGANSDVTDRKLAALELAATQRLQAAIQDAAGVSIIATDPYGVITSVNAMAEKMLGYESRELVFKHSPQIFHDRDEVVHRAKWLSETTNTTVEPGFDVFAQIAKGGKVAPLEWTYIHKNGTRLPVVLSVTALLDNDGTTTGYLGVASDISEQKKTERELQKMNFSLERSNQELAQFAYVASHDLQEPLRKVTAFCDLLMEDCIDQIDDGGKRYVGYIVDGAKRMRSLIQDLLAYSQVQTLEHQTELLDIRVIASFAVDTLSEAIAESDATITFGEMPQAHANARQMEQLFQNLIGNAIKYHGDQSPVIQIEGEFVDGNARYSVSDNGIGIKREYREQVFGIFKRLHNQTAYKGTGIGLAICQRIVDRLEGRIWVEESPLGGSTFLFEFPSDSDVPFEANV
ncbi:Phytochrome-like protein cph1 [Rubripirellula lacrimiformis]|uniref:histidine kinase n=1 Tax=Rubripirellula lacrimiformis TaxID=1930273 RepID=A0A517NEA5_9BACT|nr:CHASE domain-containing protein [Rubripirellula lacrimiformis]QDT05452.1 Phytochrome-like protein cph1 [Rubripirellula lacrimiformis]